MFKAGAIGIGIAIIGVGIAFFIADAISGPLLVTPPGGDEVQEVNVGLAIFSTVFAGVIGIGIAAVCKQFLSNPAAAFLGICAVALIIYAILPFTASEEVSTGIWLNVMHIVAAVPIVGSLVNELRTEPTA